MGVAWQSLTYHGGGQMEGRWGWLGTVPVQSLTYRGGGQMEGRWGRLGTVPVVPDLPRRWADGGAVGGGLAQSL